MPELKSLLMMLVITVVGAGATLYIKNQIDAPAPVAETVTPVSTSTITVVESTSTDPSGDRVAMPTNPATEPVEPPPTAATTLTGTLSEVNTGCYSDGVCYAIVDGKKVVLLRGWYQGKIGKIEVADGIGGLESNIGATVTVYAGKNEDGDFTLLGNESSYIKITKAETPVMGGVCAVGGCSAQLCGEAVDMKDMVTTCEYRESYACYQTAKCERQATGKCGWTETNDLTMCLKNLNK